MKTTKQEVVTLRIEPALKERIERLAAQERRSLNAQVAMVLEDAIRRYEAQQRAAQQAA